MSGDRRGTDARSKVGTLDEDTIIGRFSFNGSDFAIVRSECIGPADTCQQSVGSLLIGDHHYGVWLCRSGENGHERDLLTQLTPREFAIAMRVAAGESNKEIARNLNMSPFTVGSYLRTVYCKTHVRSRAALSAKLVQRLGRASMAEGQ
jgi:DNA-binding CsgD family transcriptional regulator